MDRRSFLVGSLAGVAGVAATQVLPASAMSRALWVDADTGGEVFSVAGGPGGLSSLVVSGGRQAWCRVARRPDGALRVIDASAVEIPAGLCLGALFRRDGELWATGSALVDGPMIPTSPIEADGGPEIDLAHDEAPDDVLVPTSQLQPRLVRLTRSGVVRAPLPRGMPAVGWLGHCVSLDDARTWAILQSGEDLGELSILRLGGASPRSLGDRGKSGPNTLGHWNGRIHVGITRWEGFELLDENGATTASSSAGAVLGLSPAGALLDDGGTVRWVGDASRSGPVMDRVRSAPEPHRLRLSTIVGSSAENALLADATEAYTLDI